MKKSRLNKQSVQANVPAPKSTSTEDRFTNRMEFAIQGAPDFNLPKLLENRQGKYITFGDDNRYPEWLLDLYNNSPLNNAIINTKVDYIMGEGLSDANKDAAVTAFIDKCNQKGESLESVMRKCALDHEIFGGFSFQIVYTRGSTKESPEIAEIYYMDLSKLRYDLDQTHLKYARDWNSYQRIRTIVTKSYDPHDPTGTRIFYYSGTNTRDIYPIPVYRGAVNSIQTDIEISNFHLSQITNGMFPSIMIDFKNGEPTEEEKNNIERRMLQKWGGSTKAGRIFLTFSDPGTDTSPKVTPIEQPDLDKRFVVLQENVEKKIFYGHRFNPLLLGLQTPGKLGLSSEYNDADQIFQNKYVRPTQGRIIDEFEKVLKVNFPNIDLKIAPAKPITALITDEKIIVANMTQDELRQNMQDSGYITDIKPEGELIDLERVGLTPNPNPLPPVVDTTQTDTTENTNP